MKARLVIIAVFLLAVVGALGQSTDGNLYVKQFPGADVGSKLVNAMAACNPNPSVPCILVIDPSLATFAPGITPSLCSHCYVSDWRAGTPSFVTGATYPASFFGVKCNGVSDDSAALNSIGTSAPPGGYTVTFPQNGATCVHSQTITSWSVPNLSIAGNGARLKFTGTGKQIYLHSASAEVENLTIRGLVLQGNANATYGLYNDTLIARGELQFINAQDYTTACYYLANVQLMNNLDITCSKFKAQWMGVSQTTQPASGAILGASTLPFANNRKVNLTMEGVSGYGVDCKVCTNGNLFMGTSETNGTGLYVEGGVGASWGNTFLGFDTENNSTQDVLESGTDDLFVNHISTGTFTFSWAVHPEIHHGLFNSIVVDGNSSQGFISHARYNNSGSGSITMNANPLSWTVWEVHDVQTGNLYSNTAAAFRVSELEVNSQSSNTSSRRYCWMADGSGYGDFELWSSSTNTGASCGTGSPLFGYYPGTGLKEGSNVVPVQSTGTQTAGQLACIKALGPPVQIGTCTAVSGAACTTCN